jgi:branched-chain amino acid transport system substrate-binding protein
MCVAPCAGVSRFVAIATLLIASAITATAVNAADLKLGAALALSGGTEDFGKAARMGIELALKEYNDRGGYNGKKVELVIYDDETKPAKGIENITRLITRDKVFGIVGPINSGVALAVIDIVQKQQMPIIVATPTSEPIITRYENAPKSYTFRTALNDGAQTSLIIDYIKKRGYERIGILHDSTGWGQSGRDTALRLLKEAGISLAAAPEVFDQNDTDMTAQVSKMRDANLDFLICYSLPPAGVQVARSMQKLGYKVPWSGTWGLIAPNFAKLGGKELVEGVLAVTSFTIDHSDNAKAFHAKIESQYKDQGGDFFPVAAAQAYDATQLILRALDKVGPDPQKVRDALEEISDFTDAVTKIPPHPFTKGHHEALGDKAGFLAVWRDGKPVRAD